MENTQDQERDTESQVANEAWNIQQGEILGVKVG